MCGIVGALVLKNSAFIVTEPYIIRMRDTMTQRGHDGTGAWISEEGRKLFFLVAGSGDRNDV